MESRYLTPFKLHGHQPPPLSGSTPPFPDNYKTLIISGEEMKESRQDISIQQLYDFFQTNYQIMKDSLHFSMGGSMAFFETLLFLKHKVNKIIFEKPFYEPYVSAARILDFQIVFLSEIQQTDLNAALCVTNPNFFKGTFLKEQDLIKLSHNFKFIITDEVFRSSFSQDGLFTTRSQLSNQIKINSLSKSLGLSMLRFGWISASPEIIYEIKKISLLTFTDIPTPSLRIACSVLKYANDIVYALKSHYENNRFTIREFIKAHPSLKISHNFESGHFGAIETSIDLNSYCLNSNLFGCSNLWRFRIDVNEDLMINFLNFIEIKYDFN